MRSTIPSLHIPKIILIQKGYHTNFDIEQKRPLLLARSVPEKIAEQSIYVFVLTELAVI